MKEVNKYLNKWKVSLYSGMRRLNIINISIFSKFIYGLNTVSIKNPEDINKLMLKFI